jgi:hypothetical protein
MRRDSRKTFLRRFPHLAALSIPSDLNRVPVLVPASISMRLLPIVPQLRFKAIIPVAVLFAIMRAGAITEPVRVLDFLISWLPSRRDWLLSSRLFNGIVHVLIGIELLAAKVVFRLVPIAFKGFFHFAPGRFILLVPPFWIFTLFHTSPIRKTLTLAIGVLTVNILFSPATSRAGRGLTGCAVHPWLSPFV